MMNFGVEFIVLEIPQLKVKVFMETQSFNQPVQLYINFISNIAVSMKRSEERANLDGNLGYSVTKEPLVGHQQVCSRGLDIKDVTHVVNLDMATRQHGIW
jgi:superfamily II DNA/RNA helicase